MLISIHPDNPAPRKVDIVCDALESGEVIIAPTDSVYAFICHIGQKNAFDKMCRLRKLNPKKALFSFLFPDFSMASAYINQLDNQVFKLMKRNLPGPYTFIVKAGQNLPAYLKNNRKTIGLRIPDNKIISAILDQLRSPLVVASLRSEDEILEYHTDPEEIHDLYRHQVALVIDGGPGRLYPSTVVDCTGTEPEIIREGAEPLVF